MAVVAILGVYKDGPESTDAESVRGKWSAWRLPSSSPRKLWRDAEAALKEEIVSRGLINLFVYYGDDLPIEFVMGVDRIEVYDRLSPPPGPAFDASQRSYVWIRYGGIRKLEPSMRRDSFRELELAGGRFADQSRPLSKAAWAKMHHSGLVFVEDPVTTSR